MGGGGRGVESVRVECRPRLRQREVLGAHPEGGFAVGRPSRKEERAARQTPFAVAGKVEAVDGRRAHEARDEEVAGPAVDLVGCPHLLQAAPVHDRHALSQRQGLDLVVGDEDHGRAEAAVQRGDLVPGPQAQPRVQVGKRLVEEEDARVSHHRASQRHPLPLSPRQLSRPARKQVAQPQCCRRPPHPLLDLGPARSPHLESETQVLRDGHMRVERVALEDHGYVAVARRDIVHGPPPDPHLPGAGILQPRD